MNCHVMNAHYTHIHTNVHLTKCRNMRIVESLQGLPSNIASDMLAVLLELNKVTRRSLEVSVMKTESVVKERRERRSEGGCLATLQFTHYFHCFVVVTCL